MNAEARAETARVVELLCSLAGADASWTANDQVLGGGTVVTVTVRAVVPRAMRVEPWPQRYVLGSGVAP